MSSSSQSITAVLSPEQARMLLRTELAPIVGTEPLTRDALLEVACVIGWTRALVPVEHDGVLAELAAACALLSFWSRPVAALKVAA